MNEKEYIERRSISLAISEDVISKLGQLAEDRGTSVEQLAAQLLEDETEAQHGLSYGPHLRKFMYR